jgi:hypothetical protein
MTTTNTLPPQPDDIVVSGESGGVDYKPHPTGPHAAVCCDIVDLGVWQDQYPGKAPRNVRKIRLVFQTDETREDGKRFTVGRLFTASLGEKANLRKFIESWRGVSFTEEELRGFSLSKLIGAPALVQVKHRKKGEKTYADIDSVMRLPKGMEKLMVTDYVRVKDREQTPPAAPAHRDFEDFPPAILEEEDDLPF